MKINILDELVKNGVILSKAEGRRLLVMDAVKIDGKVVKTEEIEKEEKIDCINIGKRKIMLNK